MLSKKRPIALPALFLAIFVFSAQHALAYIDPGTGSYMIQILIAFLIGALFTIKGFWRKIIAFAGKLFSKKSKHGDNAV